MFVGVTDNFLNLRSLGRGGKRLLEGNLDMLHVHVGQFLFSIQAMEGQS